MSHRLARALALAALGGWLAALAPAPPAASRDAEWSAWQERIDEARLALSQAERRSEAADLAVQKMRHRRKPRGEARETLFAERDAARAARADAEQALEELLEQARRAGVPPGRLRPAEAAPAEPE
jgi:hypothetical protein